MKSSPIISRDPLFFLRGGQQQAADEGTAVPDEADSLDDDGMQRRYGSLDDVSTSDPGEDAVEMTSGDHQPAAAIDVDVDVEVAGETSTTSTKPQPAPSPLMAVVAPASALLRAAGALYSRQLTLRPVFTKALTAGIIFGLSDWCAQLIERGAGGGREEVAAADESGEDPPIVFLREPLAFGRILTAFLVGLLFFGPAANAWYSAIFKVLPSTSLVGTLQKAALGQIIFGPAFTCVFFGAGMIQAGTFSLGAWLGKIRTDLPAVWASGLGFWPFVDFVSYRYVPVSWIPLFVNFCSFVWTIYLSIVANREDVEI